MKLAADPVRVKWLLLGAMLLYLPLFAPRLTSDGALYHEILRSLAIDGDLNFANEREFYTWRYVPVFPEYGVGAEFKDTGFPRQIFNVGPALFWYPFFLVGHGLAWGLELARLPVVADGYSFPERLLPAVTSLPVVLIGVLLTLRMLRAWRRVNPEEEANEDPLDLPATLLLLLASPLPAFVLVAPTFSHSLSYLFSALFLALAVETFGKARSREQDVALGLAVGCAALMRTQCGLLLVMLAFEPWRVQGRSLPSILRQRVLSWVRVGAAAFLAFSPQIASNIVIFGELMTDPQGEGGMRWAAPRFSLVLWQAKYGLFTTTPLLLLPTLAMPLLLRRRRWLGAALLATLALQFYINAVRRDWAGVGFGMRRFIDVLPILTVAMVELLILLRSRTWLLSAALALAAVCCGWNLLYMGQYYISDLSQPNLGPPFLEIVSRTASEGPAHLSELASRSLLATRFGDLGWPALLDLGIFAGLLLLIGWIMVVAARLWPLISELFPITVLSLGASLLTINAFFLYSGSSTRHVRAFDVDHRVEASPTTPIQPSPGLLATLAEEAQTEERITRSRHLALREEAAYEGHLGGFRLGDESAVMLAARPTYPGGFLDEGTLVMSEWRAPSGVLTIESATEEVVAIDVVISYESYQALPGTVLRVELRPPAGSDQPHRFLTLVKDPTRRTLEIESVDSDAFAVETAWTRPFANTGPSVEGRVSIRATFAEPVAVGTVHISGGGDVVVHGFTLEIPRPS